MDRTPGGKSKANQEKVNEEEDGEVDDVKSLTPVASILKFTKEIQDIKWILNDTFLMIVLQD